MKINIPQLKIKNDSFGFLAILPELLARNAFFICIVFIMLALLLGGVLYMRIDVIIRSQPSERGQSFKFKKETYEQVLNILDDRAEKFILSAEKEYPNLFSPAR